MQGACEALAFAGGEDGASDYRVHIPPQVDVRAIRRQTGLSQKEFAARYGFSFGRIRDWEQGRSPVDAPSRILLTIIRNEPEAVERALSAP
ncbi:helix-turn-helix domain-containing protein [Aquamicrobium sp. NLF2-7]|uniref:helix-turn-helix domain-containing protein n=1 Tax=Aquamicrobium sp. NLF2-7 TaxID=2918753 RepID=UPI001EFAC726|nr:helix-turn-helix domain-containing protein [Aquamicrobium sp. NLF2-7]MCG8273507.1 helix-turn-helix domain-containing protein [Aquamicrobium sp. NLF2-7]MCG8273800.1 helix-turn-helix domain-containing protein [Aquamicrobium sp. NLF2-7]